MYIIDCLKYDLGILGNNYSESQKIDFRRITILIINTNKKALPEMAGLSAFAFKL